MNTSEKIRALAKERLSTAEIARRLGIRYQHAYNVLNAGRGLAKSSGDASTITVADHLRGSIVTKPPLAVEKLVDSGFALSARWILAESGELMPDSPLPKAAGVYAFANDGIVRYVGVATMGLAKRLYFYGKPGVTQRTSQRLNGIIRNELLTAQVIEIYTAVPPDFQWNGLPVHGSAGLELGLIKQYALSWNMRSTG